MHEDTLTHTCQILVKDLENPTQDGESCCVCVHVCDATVNW